MPKQEWERKRQRERIESKALNKVLTLCWVHRSLTSYRYPRHPPGFLRNLRTIGVYAKGYMFRSASS